MAYDLDEISKKRIRINNETSIDYISQLPDSIIQHILSFLPAKYAIETSILSKRWVSLWAQVPVLDFSVVGNVSTSEFYRFVNEALRNYRGDKVKKLVIPFGYERWFRSQVDNWVRFASERNVEELHLVVLSIGGIGYELSQSIYSNSSLKLLKIKRCKFKPSGCVSWTSLKVLSIKSGHFSNDAIVKVLSGCPKLEYLELLHLICDDNLMISALNVKELLLHYWSINLSSIEILGPNIRSLSLFGDMAGRIIRLKNMSSLLEVESGIDSIGYTMLIGLLDQLRHVHKLTIKNAFLEVLSRSEMQPLPSTLKCRSLTVATSVKRSHLHGIVKLLQISPDLEKLTINMLGFGFHNIDSNTKCWESIKTNIGCDRLKIVEFTGFEGRYAEFHYKFFVSVLEYLLKNATLLEKIVIYAQSKEGRENKFPDAVNLAEVNKLISSCPKASANVMIIFGHSLN